MLISIGISVFFAMALDASLDKNEIYETWIVRFKRNVEATSNRLKLIDDAQMFEKDEDVGVVFSDIRALIEELKDKTQ